MFGIIEHSVSNFFSNGSEKNAHTEHSHRHRTEQTEKNVSNLRILVNAQRV